MFGINNIAYVVFKKQMQKSKNKNLKFKEIMKG